MAKNLTTLFLFKQYAGLSLTNTTDDAKIVRLIDYVSQAIAKYCDDRVFEETTYRSWYDGTGRSYMLLPQWPITRLYSVSCSTVNAMKVENTAGKWATVMVRDAVMYLNSTDSAGAEATEISIAFATYADIDALAAQINAQTGWEATVETNQGEWSTQLIRPIDGEWCANGQFVEIELADEPNQAQVGDTNRQRIEAMDFAGFPSGRKNIFVWYKAGYELPEPADDNVAPTTAGNVPEDLTLVCNQILKAISDSSAQKAGGYKSEKMGNYSYTLDAGARAATQQALLDNTSVLMDYKSAKVI